MSPKPSPLLWDVTRSAPRGAGPCAGVSGHPQEEPGSPSEGGAHRLLSTPQTKPRGSERAEAGSRGEACCWPFPRSLRGQGEPKGQGKQEAGTGTEQAKPPGQEGQGRLVRGRAVWKGTERRPVGLGGVWLMFRRAALVPPSPVPAHRPTPRLLPSPALAAEPLLDRPTHYCLGAFAPAVPLPGCLSPDRCGVGSSSRPAWSSRPGWSSHRPHAP